VEEYSPQRHGVRRDRSVFDQELFTLRPRRLRGELSFDRYAKSGYCHEGLLSRTNQAAENGEDIGRGIEQ